MSSGSFEEHQAVVAAAATLAAGPLEAAIAETVDCLRRGGRVWTMGNGGSAAQAQHAAAELVGRFNRERTGWPACALTADSATVTAIANDYGFDQVFARQIVAMCREGDVVVALSTSGNSANILRGVEAARSVGCRVVGMSGAGGGKMSDECDVLVTVPSENVARIQEVHELFVHIWVEEIERRMLAAEPTTES